MNFEYETDRLILKLLKPSDESAVQVLDFYSRNRTAFERYEAARPNDFYTKEYHKKILANEFYFALQKKCFRFWICEKKSPMQIIGTICFYNIIYSIYDRCETGYKFDEQHQHKGYALESMECGISLMFDELNLHRIEAYVMDDNLPSIRLLKKLSFQCEGICRQAIHICGTWEDHLLFARIR